MWLAVCARCGVVWSHLNLPVLSSMVTVSFEHFIKNLPCLSVRLFRLPWRSFVQHEPAGLRCEQESVSPDELHAGGRAALVPLPILREKVLGGAGWVAVGKRLVCR